MTDRITYNGNGNRVSLYTPGGFDGTIATDEGSEYQA
jgi:hypothetical protein